MNYITLNIFFSDINENKLPYTNFNLKNFTSRKFDFELL